MLTRVTLTQHWHLVDLKITESLSAQAAHSWPNGQNQCCPDNADPTEWLALAKIWQGGFKDG